MNNRLFEIRTQLIAISLLFLLPAVGLAQRQVEQLDRGLLALRLNSTEVYVAWRMLTSDPDDITFNLYRSSDGIILTKLNEEPIDSSTNWVDTPPGFNNEWFYIVKPIRGDRFYPTSGRISLEKNAPQIPTGLDAPNVAINVKDGIVSVDRIGVGDLDGDGIYDYVLKHPKSQTDPGVWNTPTETYKIDAYNSKGEFLWRKDLGWNIVTGIWWSPMIVYDLDGDGRAEVISKTAPLEPDYRASSGRVDSGPEYFSVFDGKTGDLFGKGDWIPRGNISDWGDSYGNRVNRNLMCIAYLDGKNPSLIILRGTYGLMKAEAWNYRDNQLTRVWSWSNEDLGPEYQSQGFHNIHVYDIDNDGKDEILNGALVIDDDGSTLWSTGQGHGDRFFLTDIDPQRDGMEVWYIQEDREWYDLPVALRDASTGELIWGVGDDSWGDVGRGMVADIHPGYPGMEVWSPQGALYSAKGQTIAPENPRYANTFVCDFAVWWDDDLQRELTQGGRLLKYNHAVNTVDRIGTVSSAYTIADVLGDWREEIIGFRDGAIRVCTPATLSTRRFRTFMHDPLYRLDVSFMTMGYAQIPNLSFYFGEGMDEPPVQNIYTSHGTDTAYTSIPARFDFGSREGSPVKEGFKEILAYAGNGWLYTGDLEDYKDSNSDALYVDQIRAMEPGIFQVPVPPGEYKVIVYGGDQQESGYTRILAEDRLVLDLVTEMGQFKADSFIVDVEDGVMDLIFAGSPWKISGIEIYNSVPINTMVLDEESAPRIYLDQNLKILNIESNESIAFLNLWNIKGQLMHYSNNEDSVQVDMSGFEPGIYIVQCQMKNQVYTRKLLFSPSY